MPHSPREGLSHPRLHAICSARVAEQSIVEDGAVTGYRVTMRISVLLG